MKRILVGIFACILLAVTLTFAGTAIFGMGAATAAMPTASGADCVDHCMSLAPVADAALASWSQNAWFAVALAVAIITFAARIAADASSSRPRAIFFPPPNLLDVRTTILRN